jgi:hypothetical protein
MNDNQKKGILFVGIGIVCFLKLGEILDIISVSLYDIYYEFNLNVIIPIALISWGVNLYFSKGNNDMEEINAEGYIHSYSDKYNDAGVYLIKSVNKFFIVMGLTFFNTLFAFNISKFVKSLDDIEYALKLTKVIYFLIIIITILALLDLKKAGKSLKK